MRYLVLFAVLLVIVQPAGASSYEEQSARDQLSTQSDFLMHQKKFEELNALEIRYRDVAEKTPSGYQLLPQFYNGLVAYARGQAPDINGKPNDTQWNAAIALAESWVQQKPSPAATIALASFYIQWAWAYRGDATADKVKAGAWNPFFLRLEEARKVLEAAKTQASADPQWYRTMIILSRAEQWNTGETVALYKEALEKNPRYDGIYFEIAGSMSPQWGGSWPQFDSFARYAVTRTKATDGTGLYARIYAAISPICGCDLIKDSGVHWNILKDSFTDLVSRYPSQWNIGSFAYFACMARDKDAAKPLLSRMTEFSADTWDNRVDYYQDCRKWALGA